LNLHGRKIIARLARKQMFLGRSGERCSLEDVQRAAGPPGAQHH